MNDIGIRPILNDDKTWLAAQPGMQPWDDACVRLAALLSDSLWFFRTWQMITSNVPAG